jgi:hypothetical protein
MSEPNSGLYHFSEDPDIRRFDPRHSDLVDDRVVWAVEADHQHLYLFPRQCPRVTFYAGAQTTDADRERFLGLGTASKVVAIESAWLPAMKTTTLYRYELPSASFELEDECAGYWVSRDAVEPARVDVIDDLLAALPEHGAEVRILPSLWPLYEAVIASTLQFSIIRWRNVAPRTDASVRRSA